MLYQRSLTLICKQRQILLRSNFKRKMSSMGCFDSANADPSGDRMEDFASKPVPSKCCLYVGACLAVTLLLFPVVTIPILFTMVRGTKNTGMQTLATNTFPTFSSIYNIEGSSSSMIDGRAVSLTPTGGVQIGAGTSIYRGVGEIPPDACPKYLSGTPLFNNKFLVSYTDAATMNGVISVMSIDESRKSSVVATSQSKYDLYHILTLDQETGLFITISQDQGYPKPANTSVVMAGRSDSTNYAISYGTPIRYSDKSSLDPSICALSKTSFSIGYFGFNYDPYTRFGVIDPKSLNVVLSKPFYIAGNPNYGFYSTMTRLTDSKLMVLYYDSGAGVGKRTLHAVVVNNIIASNGSLSQSITKPAMEYAGSDLGKNLIKATTLDSNDVVVAYGDANTNFGITCTLVKYNDATGMIYFGSNLQITTGNTVNFLPNSYAFTALSIETVGGGSQFMVMFVDLALDGSVVTTIGESAKSILVRASPNYVLNDGIAAANTIHTYVSVSVSRRDLYSSEIALLYSLTDTKCKVLPITDFSFMEIRPKPIGVFTGAATGLGSTGYVSVSGVVTGFAGLKAGLTYYSTTTGQLVTDGTFYGRDAATSSNGGANGFYYVTDIGNSVIVDADSQVGIALSPTTLALTWV